MTHNTTEEGSRQKNHERSEERTALLTYMMVDHFFFSVLLGVLRSICFSNRREETGKRYFVFGTFSFMK